MKIKRYKRVKRLVSIFRNNFDFKPPYRVLIDGTFAMAALNNKINLREQMPKYLCEEVVICVTPCVLAELEKLGSFFYGALHICRQFEVEKCPHKPERRAADCLLRMARRMEHKTKYFIATQDADLTEKLRGIPGVPILFIKYNGILIDRASEATLQVCFNLFFMSLKEKIRKKKRIKGPNPLSVKKKKVKNVVISTQEGTKTANGKRKRRKRKDPKTFDANVANDK
uniref:rRNA-processing protein UTP23 homolog n=1 Tax=Syphacia muris TaxID=451379 RepID=A0A0N5AQQ7_9BILA